MSFSSSNWQGDAIGNPEGIPLGEWWRYGLRLKAVCPCGHSREIQTADLLKRYGEFRYADERLRTDLAPRLKCIRCEQRAPTLAFEVAGHS